MNLLFNWRCFRGHWPRWNTASNMTHFVRQGTSTDGKQAAPSSPGLTHLNRPLETDPRSASITVSWLMEIRKDQVRAEFSGHGWEMFDLTCSNRLAAGGGRGGPWYRHLQHAQSKFFVSLLCDKTMCIQNPGDGSQHRLNSPSDCYFDFTGVFCVFFPLLFFFLSVAESDFLYFSVTAVKLFGHN